MGIRSFNQTFLDTYNIEKFFAPDKKGGQKSVHFVVIKGEKQVMKLFEGGKDDRFEREMEIYEKYKDIDGIPKIFSISEYHGETVIFEQYIEGDTLLDITEKYSENNSAIKELVKNLFDILTPVWKDKYVHRDLKPENIIIRKNGKPVVIDFGIARDLAASSITGTGRQPGSWKWAAPEQYNGQKDMISYRTDFFSIGVIAYFLFHQCLPFGNRPEDIDAKFKNNEEAINLSAQCDFKNFLEETLRFRPSHRPKNIEDLYKLI